MARGHPNGDHAVRLDLDQFSGKRPLTGPQYLPENALVRQDHVIFPDLRNQNRTVTSRNHRVRMQAEGRSRDDARDATLFEFLLHNRPLGIGKASVVKRDPALDASCQTRGHRSRFVLRGGQAVRGLLQVLTPFLSEFLPDLG